jgi:hypothetical protein
MTWGILTRGIKNSPIEHVSGDKMALVSENIDISQLLYLAIIAKYIVITGIIIIFIPSKSLPSIFSFSFDSISEKVLE